MNYSFACSTCWPKYNAEKLTNTKVKLMTIIKCKEASVENQASHLCRVTFFSIDRINSAYVKNQMLLVV